MEPCRALMINFLRSAPCKTMSLLPTLTAKCATCIMLKVFFLHVQCVCVHYCCATEPVASCYFPLNPSSGLSPSPCDLSFMHCCCRPWTLLQEEQMFWCLKRNSWICGVIQLSLLGFLQTGSTQVKRRLFTLNLLESVKAKSFQPAI